MKAISRSVSESHEGHVTPLCARVNGQILEVRVIEGQTVAGDVLTVIDPKGYKFFWKCIMRFHDRIEIALENSVNVQQLLR